VSSLSGKTALITGSGGGIGRAIALELARRGARIVVNDFRNPSGVEETCRQVQELGVEALGVDASVALSTDVARMFDQATEKFGGVEILVNNAGIQVETPLLELSEDDWDRVLAVNLKGTFLCTQEAARRMRDRGTGGRIVNIGSGCNFVGFPNLVSYTASKGGIQTFTKVAAVELGVHGINVNCVAPGAIENERTREELPDYAGTWGRMAPVGRVGQPEDVAGAVAYLVSDEASFVSGHTLQIDGGLFARSPWPTDAHPGE